MSWLNNRDIINKLKRNGDKRTLQAFYGVYPIDKLPNFLPHFPIFIIVNTHTHNLEGEHWKVVFVDSDRSGEVFDSLAQHMSAILVQWLNRFTRKWKTNPRPYQNPLSATCGAYALYFTLIRLSFPSFEDVTETLTRSPPVNDHRVLMFYRRLK